MMRHTHWLLAVMTLGASSSACLSLRPFNLPEVKLDSARLAPDLARLEEDEARCRKQSDAPISIEEEYKLGGAVAVRWVQQGGGLIPQSPESSLLLTRYLNTVGKHLAARSSRPLLDWTFGVLDSSGINAVSSPGGYVFVSRGLLREVRNEAELAGVLAHEIAHVTRKHALSVFAESKFNVCKSKAVAHRVLSVDLDAQPEIFQELSRNIVDTLTTHGLAADDEFEADQDALRLVIAAGYRPSAFLDVLARLPEGNPVFRNHPGNAERRKRLETWLAAQRNPTDGFPDVDPDFDALPLVPFGDELAWVEQQH